MPYFGNYRGPACWICNINLKISKKGPAIFHNLKSYDSHLIFKEFNKFNCKVSVIPNGLEKYMSFTLNGNNVFIDSMLFKKSSLDKLVKNLADEDFKYLSEVFSGEKLELVKKKDFIFMSILTVLRSSKKVNYLILINFLVH